MSSTVEADPTRVITRRAVALVIDAFLITALPALTVIVIGHSRTVTTCPDPIPDDRSCFVWRGNGVVVENRSLLWFLSLFAALYLLVFVVVQGRTGASPGKSLLGVRVIDHRGNKPGFARSAVRALAWAIDAVTLLVPIALWSAWCTPGHRRVGDFLGGTYVVRLGGEDFVVRRHLSGSGLPPDGHTANSG